MVPYRAPAWLPGGHLQTLYSALAAPRPRVSYRRERWETPDGDFIDLDWIDEDRGLRIEDSATRIPDHWSHYSTALKAVRAATTRSR